MSQDVQSMTGFGRYTAEKDQKKITVEMKSVNHRYLDLSVITLPPNLIRIIISGYVYLINIPAVRQ